MKDLKSVSPDTYNKAWKRLDKQPEGTKNSEFRDVALEFMFEKEDIWELEKELHTSSSGSPSRQLLEGLEAKRPGLTVFEFIKVKNRMYTGRDDIIQLLQNYIYT